MRSNKRKGGFDGRPSYGDSLPSSGDVKHRAFGNSGTSENTHVIEQDVERGEGLAHRLARLRYCFVIGSTLHHGHTNKAAISIEISKRISAHLPVPVPKLLAQPAVWSTKFVSAIVYKQQQ